ncbi:hypothetical protein F5J12DRAFT_731619 [Pisolithus orientalis]|uniref:uncharacterized protein n=1 Tax=Pisolithus orientalis TaxID=936130 RepID=UPI00222569E1|nr:uncharacterized protein F5J12DRAFT_731619 [Pisolithus orientalis]KAI5981153.1 hypothetical protein F5J12DRAFT_731619 [Pisolithus orientalis]
MYDPESGAHIEQLCDGCATQDSGKDGEPWNAWFSHSLKQLRKNYFIPFLNVTVWHLMSWFYNGSTQKSQSDLNNLVHNVILAADFDCKDLHSFVAQQELRQMDESTLISSNSWYTTSVTIWLPCEGVKVHKENAPKFKVEELHYHKLTDVIKAAFAETAAEEYNVTPYKLFWQADDDTIPEQVFGEVYMADIMLQEHKTIKAQP